MMEFLRLFSITIQTANKAVYETAEFTVLQQNMVAKHNEMEEESMCCLKQMKENLLISVFYTDLNVSEHGKVIYSYLKCRKQCNRKFQ